MKKSLILLVFLIFSIGLAAQTGNKVSSTDNNIRAVRVDNLIRRVMGLPVYPRPDHGGVKIPNPTQLP